MARRLPVKVSDVPIIDAVCEIRVQASADLHSILPGILFKKLPGLGRFETLPMAALPESMRTSAQLNSMLTRVAFGDCVIIIGTRNLLVSPVLPPYPGWDTFRATIEQVFSAVLAEDKLITNIERYSIKYVNMLKVREGDSRGPIEWKIEVGPFAVDLEPTVLRTEKNLDGVATVIQAGTGMTVQLSRTNEQREGVLLEVDSIVVENLSPQAFRDRMRDRLDRLHLHTKQVFFDCLRDDAIAAMGPTYG